MSQRVNITSPVGRIVRGNLYKPNDRDAEGKPLVIKSGPNAGTPRVDYFFAVAIPKNPGETHWANTVWGQQIWGVGHTAFPGAAQSPTFAWKIEDGDSQIPNKRGKKPCDLEGHKGHWIIKFSGGFAPQIYQQDSNGQFVQITQKDFVKTGYYVQVSFNVEGNGSQTQPGIYINHSQVCFRGYGEEISYGPDVNAAGFGLAPLPPGASAVPLAVSAPLPITAPPVAMLPPVPGGGYAPVAPAMPAPTMPSAPIAVPVASPMPIMPQPGFVNLPPAPAAPVAAPVRQMTAAATASYEAYKAGGWTDAQLVQNGLMLA